MDGRPGGVAYASVDLRAGPCEGALVSIDRLPGATDGAHVVQLKCEFRCL